MKIDLYAVCWNEIQILPYFIRHYQRWVDRFIIADDGSSDGSIEYLRQFSNVEVRPLERRFKDSVVESIRCHWEECWKESRGRADWVILTNIDEHLFHESFLSYLHECQQKGVTAILGIGYQMISDKFPDTDGLLCDVIQHGALLHRWNKLSLFDPNAIEATNYAVGRHTAAPTGKVIYPKIDAIRNLHYKYLGLDYLSARLSELKTGLGPRDIRNKWGYQYLWNPQEISEAFETVKASAELVVYPGVGPETRQMGKRWWRFPQNILMRWRLIGGVWRLMERVCRLMRRGWQGKVKVGDQTG